MDYCITVCGSSYEAQHVALADIIDIAAVDVADLTVAHAAAYFSLNCCKLASNYVLWARVLLILMN